jgi:hypothetical protein
MVALPNLVPKHVIEENFPFLCNHFSVTAVMLSYFLYLIILTVCLPPCLLPTCTLHLLFNSIHMNAFFNVTFPLL